MDLDYSCWREDDGERDRWHWETMAVDDDGNEMPLDAGIEDTEEQAILCVATSMRNHAEFKDPAAGLVAVGA